MDLQIDKTDYIDELIREVTDKETADHVIEFLNESPEARKKTDELLSGSETEEGKKYVLCILLLRLKEARKKNEQKVQNE